MPVKTNDDANLNPKQDHEKNHVLHKLRSMEVCAGDDFLVVVGKSTMQDEEVALAAQVHIGTTNVHIEVWISDIKSDFNIMAQEKDLVTTGNAQDVDKVTAPYTDWPHY